MTEPAITINGHVLTTAQAMTIRVALGSFALTLQSDGLGEDEVGKSICAGYLGRISEINNIISV